MEEQQVEQQEPQEPQEQGQQTVDDAQEDAAMKAAIAEARGDEPPVVPEPAETQQVDAPETTEAKETPEEPKAILAGLTEEQVKQLLAKAGEVDDLKAQVRVVHGRFGELNSRIQHLNKVGMSEEDLSKAKSIATKYHEAILDGDMEKANELYLQSMQLMPRQQVQQPQIDIGSALTEQTQKFEVKLLSMKHPDWRQQYQSSDFSLWMQTIPEADRQELGNSWDAAYISNKLDEFKSWRSKSTQSGQQTQKKQQRLVNAVTPQGTAHAVPNPVTEEEAMQAAIRARLRPRLAAT